MNLKLYKNEIIVVTAFFLMFSALFYKNSQISSQSQEMLSNKQTVKEFGEVVSLQKIWANKSISKKVDRLKKSVSSSKVTWKKKSKKLTARYKELDPKELNKVVTTILSMAVQIQELKIVRDHSTYNLEFKCKW